MPKSRSSARGGGQRPYRVGEQLREVLSEMLMTGSIGSDAIQRAGMVSFTEVRMSPDLGTAKVFTSVFPAEEVAVRDVIDDLTRLAPRLRSMVGKQVRLRHTPELRFLHDDSMERGARMESLIHEIHGQDAEPPLEEDE